MKTAVDGAKLLMGLGQPFSSLLLKQGYSSHMGTAAFGCPGSECIGWAALGRPAPPPIHCLNVSVDSLRPNLYIFRSDQFVPRPLNQVFEFFSRAENLQQLTPPWLHFHILTVDPQLVRKGTLIRYFLRWRIFPIRWTTEIIDWDPPHRFVDLQLTRSLQTLASPAPVHPRRERYADSGRD